MTGFVDPPAWASSSTDPNDETFGDVVEPADPETAGAFDAVLVGEPYDGAVIGRGGAREGPAALRDELAGTKTHHFEAGPAGGVGDVGDVGGVGDGGDVGDVGDLQLPDGGDGVWEFGDADVRTVQQRAAEATRRIHDSTAFPVFLGGDNSLTVPNVAPLLDRGSVGAISLDAHLDCRALEDGPSSGTPYRQLLERGLDALCVLGARHFETSTAYADFLDRQGGEVVTADAVGRDLEGAIERAREAVAGLDRVYLSLDLDVLDAAHGPGVSAPTPGGLTSREAFECCRRLGSHPPLAGFEVVECAPPLDRDRKTARAGARAIAHMLAGRATPTDDRRGTDRSPRGDSR